jgi:hypothetical protein
MLSDLTLKFGYTPVYIAGRWEERERRRRLKEIWIVGNRIEGNSTIFRPRLCT